MHYFIFNNDIWVSQAQQIRRLKDQEQERYPFSDVTAAHVCLVDVDVMVAVAPEERAEQKDMVLAREFSSQYSGEFIIQDERIGTNQFQVVGAKAERVREIYRLFPGESVRAFVPYAMALRAYLTTQETIQGRPVAFVDDLDGEILITFFEGLKFSQTRRFHEEQVERIFPEIKRSAISFSKALKKENGPYVIMTNNPEWARKLSLLEPGLEILSVSSPYPAMEGLKTAQFPVKFELPEEVIKRSREKERQNRLPFYLVSAVLGFSGFCFALFYQISYAIHDRAYQHVMSLQSTLEDKLTAVDREVYRSALRQSPGINYGEIYFWIRSIVPSSYEIHTIAFSAESQHRIVQVDLVLPKGADFEEIPASHLMGKKMVIENILVKDRPGKSIRIEL